ncbi:BadF/BadG/BcrA/BcrD ATPase family protein [Roseibium sp.]|uniref:BadF/BadG/BcrA/BcrD ATPase family protein n=1 Tax=Roseibium sp. TaxID=1936156 RepID=UPI003D0FCA85
MIDFSDQWVLAVDGGGTRCRLALSSPAADIRVEVGSANVTTDIYAALSEINVGLKALAGKADLAQGELARVPAYFALAGYQADRDREQLLDGVPLRRIKVEDDRPAALLGALGCKDGALIHSGTGSFFGVQVDATTRFSGGWGAVLGDFGSAAWFGKSALALVLDAEDGLFPRTVLAEALNDRFGGVAGILAFAITAAPADFGALAPEILSQSDDPISQQLIGQAVSHFDENLRHLGWSAGMPVCLTGGLAPHLAPFLTEPVRKNLRSAAGSPIDGAIAIAREFAKEVQVAC